MKIQSLFIVSLLSLFCTVAFAEQATGLCKDGTTYTGESKRGACRGHKGLQEWFGDKQAAPASSAAPAPAPAPMAAAPGASISGTATGLCKDGTTYSGSSKRGACRGHKGLQEWYADKQTAAPAATAQPAAVPASAAATGAATGLCKDGTAYTGASKRGACRGHKGLQEWYADKQAPAAATPAATETAPASTTATAAPSAAATGICKDGTEYTGASKRGACRGHKGVKEWFADKQTTTSPTPAAATAPAAVPVPASTAAPAAQPAVPASTAAPAAPAAAQATAPAAGAPGMVWVNTNSKIYHCQGSKFYGRTKQGEYMTEAQAQSQGFNANRKKTCNINR